MQVKVGANGSLGLPTEGVGSAYRGEGSAYRGVCLQRGVCLWGVYYLRGGGVLGRPPSKQEKRVVRILLECFLVGEFFKSGIIL